MPSELASILNPADQRALASAVRDMGDLLGIDRLRVAITATQVTPGTWLYSVQVVNRRGIAIKTTADLKVYVSTTKGGAPGGAQTENFLTGTVIFTDQVGVEWEVRTDPTGRFTMTLAFATGSRYLNGGMVREYTSSQETTA